jgi:PleD family two-component response regulator
MIKNTPKNILIIEDETLLQEALIDKLSNEGFIVSGSVNAKDAYRKLNEVRPDIILTDLVLPGIDGFEIIETIKGDESFRNIPILVLSNLGEKEDIDRAMSLGATDFLIKSNISLKEVTKQVKKILLNTK